MKIFFNIIFKFNSLQRFEIVVFDFNVIKNCMYVILKKKIPKIHIVLTLHVSSSVTLDETTPNLTWRCLTHVLTLLEG